MVRRLCALVLHAAVLCACRRPPPPPVVAVVDDGERVPRRGELPVLRGVDNGVWSPGQPVRLFGLPGETVALQVVVSAAAAPLRGVTVELPALSGPSRRVEAIERLVPLELALPRRSGGREARESLGWEAGARPREPAAPGTVPDPLVPIAFAPAAADYPMSVAPGEHRPLWLDVTLPEALPPGTYRGALSVRAGATPLAELEVQLQVGPAVLPWGAAKTLLYYEPGELLQVTGDPAARRHYLQLLHRHQVSTIYRVNGPADVAAQREELSGALFSPAAGYDGPGAGRPAEVISLGTYGTLGPPTAERLDQLEAALRALGDAGALAGRPLLFLYAVDEQCESPAGPAWRAALAARPALRQVLVGHTCSEPPAQQPVDLAIVHAGRYDVAQAERARAAGKRVWIYNGLLPRTGSFLSDGGALSLRANGWIQAHAGIERWFYWESTFWLDNNRGGRGPYDPLATAETFHNHHGDVAMGDGVLVYPGRQRAPGRLSLGAPGVLSSFRLKQWRRGISDAGYLALVRARGPEGARLAEEVAGRLLGPVLSAARPGAAAFPDHGAPYLAARRRLFDFLAGHPR